jgi:hypothetical protein
MICLPKKRDSKRCVFGGGFPPGRGSCVKRKPDIEFANA